MRDCSEGEHWGYTYLTAECRPMRIETWFGIGILENLMFAPEGFAWYKWTRTSNPMWIVEGSSRRMILPLPFVDGDTVTCEVTSGLGNSCTASMHVFFSEISVRAKFAYGVMDTNGYVPVIENDMVNWYDTCTCTATFVDLSTAKNCEKDNILWKIIKPNGSILATSSDSLFTYTFPYPDSIPVTYRIILTVSYFSLCDSIQDSITIYPSAKVSISYSDEICQGGSYTDDNFSNLTIAGVYYRTLCDSIIEFTLTVKPTYMKTETVKICLWESYNFRGKTYTASGTYYDTLQTVFGCDSIFKLILTVNPTYFVSDTATISYGNSYNFHGKLLTEQGIYYDTLQSIHGCDSIIALTLMVTDVGIKQWTMDNVQFIIYPNPTNGKLRIENYELSMGEIEIYDVVGRVVETLHAASLPVIDISHLENGIYFLKINYKILKIIKY